MCCFTRRSYCQSSIHAIHEDSHFGSSGVEISHTLAEMVCELDKDLPQFQQGEPGTCPIARQLLARAAGCCLVTALLLVAYVGSPLQLSPQDRTFANDSRKLLSFNTSEQSSQLYNASTKQWVVTPGGPGFVLCGNPEEVSNIRVCNYGATRILPHTSQPAPGTGQWVYWALRGDWVAFPQCYLFDAHIMNHLSASAGNLPIECRYMREGENLWHTCAGGNYKYKRGSQCVGDYVCDGNPVVCTKAALSFIIP